MTESKLPEGEYTVSWYCVESVPCLVRRPWWNLLGQDRLEYNKGVVLKRFSGLSAAEGKLLREALFNYWQTDLGRLLRRFMGKHQTMLMLESGHAASQYLATNLAFHSEDLTGWHKTSKAEKESI